MIEANIIKLIRTVEEQNESINLVEKLFENTYKDRFDPAIVSGSSFGKNLWVAISGAIASRRIGSDRQEVEKFLNSLLFAIRGLNSLKITIAVTPSDNLIINLQKWAKKNLSENIIFDIKVDPQILGGAIIISDKGEFADFTLSKKINDVFSAKLKILLR